MRRRSLHGLQNLHPRFKSGRRLHSFLAQFQIDRWPKDLDATKGIELEQIAVSGHNEIRAAIHRGLKELVIVWIAARLNPLNDLDDLDER